MRLFVFGYGFTARALARRLNPKGWSVAATVRRPEDAGGLEADGVAAVALGDPTRLSGAVAAADALLVCAPPDAEGCPGLIALAPALANARPGWIGYLSTTGVYGDRRGRWVFETSPLNAQSAEGARRVAAEVAWAGISGRLGLTTTMFRLPGIYGPGRSTLDRVREGRARRITAPDHVFSRIHVDDLAAGLEASIARPRPGGIYNLCDDEPAANSDVVAFACALLGVDPPPETRLDAAKLPPAAVRFYAESKRVSNARAKAELGWRPAYPSYREGLRAILEAESEQPPSSRFSR